MIIGSIPTSGNVVAVKNLAEVCESEEGITLDFGWEALPDDEAASLWLCGEEKGLLGAGLVYRIGGSAEVVLLVHPSRRRQGIGTSLIDTIMEDCRTKGENSVILITDRRSQSGTAFISDTGATYARSEHRMESASGQTLGELTACVRTDVQLREATIMDLDQLVADRMECFSTPEDEGEAAYELTRRRIGNPKCLVYLIADAQGLVVGQLTLSFEATNPYIYGLCVLPQHQGKGYGSAALNQAVKVASSKTQVPVHLEVETANDSALKVYERAGFQTIATFDYYELFTAPVRSHM